MAARYVLSLICAALIAAVLQDLVKEGSCGRVLKFLCGLFLVVTALKPLKQLEFPDFEKWVSDLDSQAQSAVREGEASYQRQYAGVITRQLEAYILDKAAALGLDVTARVELTPEGLPQGVHIQGKANAPQRRRLEDAITQELGIPKERQQWQEE